MAIEMLKPIKKKKKSILSLGGIARGRKVGVGNEREFVKKTVSKRIAKEGTTLCRSWEDERSAEKIIKDIKAHRKRFSRNN